MWKVTMRKYLIIVLIGALTWLTNTWYWGWNLEPINNIERFFDVVAWTLIFWGIIGDILNGVTWHKTANNYVEIKPEKLTVDDETGTMVRDAVKQAKISIFNDIHTYIIENHYHDSEPENAVIDTHDFIDWYLGEYNITKDIVEGNNGHKN